MLTPLESQALEAARRLVLTAKQGRSFLGTVAQRLFELEAALAALESAQEHSSHAVASQGDIVEAARNVCDSWDFGSYMRCTAAVDALREALKPKD